MSASLLVAIRSDPLAFLPEVSLSLLRSFRDGYDLRCRMEGRPYDWQVSFERFGFWVRRRFHVPGQAISSAEPVVLSFSRGERQAFYRYFELLDEFGDVEPEQLEPPFELRRRSRFEVIAAMVRDPNRYIGWPIDDLVDPSALREPGAYTTLTDEETSVQKSQILSPHGESLVPTVKTDVRSHTPPKLTSLVKAIRKAPMMHGLPTFRACCSYLMGYERAQADLQASRNEDQEIYDGFRRWVETVKNRADPRPWYKVVLYNSGFGECARCENGAFSLFFRWLDEYAGTLGKPGLFRPCESHGSSH